MFQINACLYKDVAAQFIFCRDEQDCKVTDYAVKDAASPFGHLAG